METYTNILLLGIALMSMPIIRYAIKNWGLMVDEYNSWDDRARTVIILVGSLVLAGTAMHILDYLR